MKSSEIGVTKIFLFLTVLLAPLYVVRFRIGPYPSTLLEVLIGLTVISAVVDKIRAKKIRFTIYDLRFTEYLFLLAAAISVFVSPDKRGALGIFKAYFVEPILIYLVIKDVVKSKRDWELVFSALALSGLWVALLAIFQGLTGWLTFAPHEAALGRAHAVYNTANAVGLYLGPIAALALGPVMAVKSRGAPVPPSLTKNVLFFALVGLVVIFTKSAGALTALATVILYLAVHSALLHRPHLAKNLVRYLKLLVVSAVLVLVVAGGWFFINISKFTPRVADPFERQFGDTLTFRLCLWEGTRNLLLDRPIFGSGLSGFKELYAKNYFTCDAEPLEYPHNWILNFWSETGLLGLLGFLWILAIYLKKTLAYLSGNQRWLTLGFIAAMLYWLIHGLVDVPYFKNDLALEFWVIVGLAETLGLAF